MPWTHNTPSLPFSGTTPTTAHCSREGAATALPRAGSQAWTVYLALKKAPQTMHELVDLTGYPMSTICARLGWLRQQNLVRVLGAKKGPKGVSNTIWSVV